MSEVHTSPSWLENVEKPVFNRRVKQKLATFQAGGYKCHRAVNACKEPNVRSKRGMKSLLASILTIKTAQCMNEKRGEINQKTLGSREPHPCEIVIYERRVNDTRRLIYITNWVKPPKPRGILQHDAVRLNSAHSSLRIRRKWSYSAQANALSKSFSSNFDVLPVKWG